MISNKLLLAIVVLAAVIAFTTIVSPITAPVVGITLNDSVSVTPNKLATLLESGNISEYNNERKQIKQQIVFESIDLSNKDLNGVDLRSIIILDSNLSNTNLAMSFLQPTWAWLLTVDLSDSDFGDDRVCASVEGGYGYGPYRICTQAGRDAAVTFDIGDGIGEGENYRVCGYTPGDLLEIIFQKCYRYTHGSGDEWVDPPA